MARRDAHRGGACLGYFDGASGVFAPVFLDHGRHLVFGEKLFPFHRPERNVIHWLDTKLGALHAFLEIVMLFVQFLEVLVVMQKCVNDRLVVLEH
jgi:hypothetical protein